MNKGTVSIHVKGKHPSSECKGPKVNVKETECAGACGILVRSNLGAPWRLLLADTCLSYVRAAGTAPVPTLQPTLEGQGEWLKPFYQGGFAQLLEDGSAPAHLAPSVTSSRHQVRSEGGLNTGNMTGTI